MKEGAKVTTNNGIAQHFDLTISQAAGPVEQNLIGYQNAKATTNSPKPSNLGFIRRRRYACERTERGEAINRGANNESNAN
jgi:hypothetical protein